jgi:hypothetical protein
MNNEVLSQSTNLKGGPAGQMQPFGSLAPSPLLWVLTHCVLGRNHMLFVSQNVIELPKIGVDNRRLNIDPGKAASLNPHSSLNAASSNLIVS